MLEVVAPKLIQERICGRVFLEDENRSGFCVENAKCPHQLRGSWVDKDYESRGKAKESTFLASWLQLAFDFFSAPYPRSLLEL